MDFYMFPTYIRDSDILRCAIFIGLGVLGRVPYMDKR